MRIGSLCTRADSIVDLIPTLVVRQRPSGSECTGEFGRTVDDPREKAAYGEGISLRRWEADCPLGGASAEERASDAKPCPCHTQNAGSCPVISLAAAFLASGAKYGGRCGRTPQCCRTRRPAYYASVRSDPARGRPRPTARLPRTANESECTMARDPCPAGMERVVRTMGGAVSSGKRCSRFHIGRERARSPALICDRSASLEDCRGCGQRRARSCRRLDPLCVSARFPRRACRPQYAQGRCHGRPL
ncbi:hypothetical protein BD413DRAFT_237890 [Trametes elegans]|nr:hypothetical protein BD413DRAFT_237890 [Trametes elegans]